MHINNIFMTNEELANYWNNKRTKNVVAYNGRAIPKAGGLKERVQIDVRTMLSKHDAIMSRSVEKYGLRGAFHDETMWNIQKWVTNHVRYLGDDVNNYTMEYWQFPFETMVEKTGDCEDGALLMAAMAINAGVPSYRIRVVAGDVQPAPTAPMGGHAYLTYLRESDNEWVILDWCYLPDSQTPINQKMKHKENPYYKGVWFSFNDENSWADRETFFDSF